MGWLIDLITNPYLLTATTSWAVAQVLKVIINAVVNKKLVWERLFGDGGMPSGHSATVSSLAAFSALSCGPDSFECAASLVLAIIVCHDAMGVRQETGKQAVVINEIIEMFNKIAEEDMPEAKLKELVGHTPIQVLAGITIGICNALLMYYIVL